MNDHVSGLMPCDTMRLGDNVVRRDYGIATPHGSDLREAINIAVVDLAETGVLDQLKQKWFSERSQCKMVMDQDSQWTSLVRFSLTDVIGIFYILITGVVLALIVAMIEFLLKTKHDSIRLKQPLGQVLRRNLRISLIGTNSNVKGAATPIEVEVQRLDDR